MGNYWDDPVTRHHNEDWDRKVDARISALQSDLDRSFIDSNRSQLELDRMKGNLYGDDDGHGCSSHDRMLDRFMRFTESASPDDLAREFAVRRDQASVRVANDDRFSHLTNVEIPKLIDSLQITDQHVKAHIKALTDEADAEKDLHSNEPGNHQYVMALFDLTHDLWFLQTLVFEWQSRKRKK